MRSIGRRAALVFAWLLGTGCSSMYGAGIHLQRGADAPPFSMPEQDAAKEIVIGICRAERFAQQPVTPTAPSASDPYLEFVALDGKGSEQDTVGVSGMMRTDRREIVIWVSDWNNGEPLPTTQKLIEDLRGALASRFPDSRIEVKARTKPRILGP